MNSYVKAIVLLDEQNQKRYIDLKRGLNIITGQSKSGKSSLIEIIDYCLGSTQPTIPKGVITEFTFMYAILVEINNKLILLGRKKFNPDGRKFMYIRYVNSYYQGKDINIEMFTEEFKLKLNNAKLEISRAFGITITNSKESEDENIQGRPSIRDMVSFLFQHQNLIANKFALFYRFENAKKRERVIKLFPVFSGWVDQNYYSLVYKLDELKKDRKRLLRNQEAINKANENLKNNLVITFERYYFLVGEKIDLKNKSIQELLQHSKWLPDYSKNTYLSDELEENYYHKKDELEKLRLHKHELEMKVRNVIEGEKLGNAYEHNLEMLNYKNDFSSQNVQDYYCPLCGEKHKEITEKATEVSLAKEWLENELKGLVNYTSYFEEEVEYLRNEINILKTKIKSKEAEIKEIEKIFKGIKEKKHLNEQIQYAKARIDIECSIIEKQMKNIGDSDIEDIDADIEYINGVINGYDIESYYREAFKSINDNMNKIINRLDFEEEFLPANLKFNLENFDLYHHDKKNNEKIYLSEMGSGANWLACHVGLFISLLKYFTAQSDSPVPSFLFIDQPSQVYFPDVFDNTKTKDIQAVL
jgi:hypothetical protein